MASTRRNEAGYLSKRDEARYRSYIADKEKETQGFGTDRDKRNRVPRSVNSSLENNRVSNKSMSTI